LWGCLIKDAGLRATTVAFVPSSGDLITNAQYGNPISDLTGFNDGIF